MTHVATVQRPLPHTLTQVERHQNGALRSCVPLEPVRVNFGPRALVAQYLEEPPRRIAVAPMEFHPTGALKGLSLQEATLVETPIGPFLAERLTFYEDGSLRRVFPTAGKPNATWTEDDERSRSPKQRILLPWGTIEARFIGLCFFPSGALRSVTLWPTETVGVATPQGTLPGRIGIAFHENGTLRSFEPAQRVEIDTPIGKVGAFSAMAVGIHGDKGSIEFAPDGTLRGLCTEEARVVARRRDGRVEVRHEAREIPSRCEESATERVALTMQFFPEEVIIDGATYAFVEHEFAIESTVTSQRRLPVLCG